MAEDPSATTPREIRQSEQALGAHTPIVGMTAHAMKKDERKCLDAGMDDYITKPLEPERLKAVFIELEQLAGDHDVCESANIE